MKRCGFFYVFCGKLQVVEKWADRNPYKINELNNGDVLILILQMSPII